jgi:GNAT superfamily N-acetyltransferase
MTAAAARETLSDHAAGHGRAVEPVPMRLPRNLRRRPARPEAAPATPSIWWARTAERGPDSVEHSLVAVNSDRFPDGTPVDLTALTSSGRRPAGWLVDVRFRAADGGVVRVDVADPVAELCPPLWFAEIAHATSGIPSASLVAFRGTTFRPGSLVGPHHVAGRGVRMADRVGQVRWWTRSGLVDTVRVDPSLRRRGVGRTLVTVAEGLRMLRGWAPLRADGRLTELGAAWLATAPPCWQPRLAARTHTLPAADEDGPTGVAALLR